MSNDREKTGGDRRPSRAGRRRATKAEAKRAFEFVKDVVDHPEKYDKGPFRISVEFLDLRGEDRHDDSKAEGSR